MSPIEGDLCQTSFQFQFLVSVRNNAINVIYNLNYRDYIVALLCDVFWTVWYLTNRVDNQFNFIYETFLTKLYSYENVHRTYIYKFIYILSWEKLLSFKKNFSLSSQNYIHIKNYKHIESPFFNSSLDSRWFDRRNREETKNPILP